MDLSINKLVQEATTAHQEGRLEDAEHLYLEILKATPKHPDANHNLGVLMFSKNRFADALPLFKVATEINPQIEIFWMSYGYALISEKKYTEAEECYKKILELNPTNTQALNNIGIILRNNNRLNEAEASYKKAIKYKPDFVDAHFNLGVVLKELDRLSEAEIILKKTIEIKPDYAEAYSILGETLEALDRLSEAEIILKKAVKIKPDFADAYQNLGITLQKLSKFDEAGANFKMSIELKPEFIELKKNIDLGDWSSSKELLKKLCTNNVFQVEKCVNEFIKLWCIHCRKLLLQKDIKIFIKIFIELFIVGERNNDLNDLFKFFFKSKEINKILKPLDLNSKLLINTSYCQYKFLIKHFDQSEKLAASNIQDATNLILNSKTEDLGWLIIRRSLAMCKSRNFARKTLNNLTSNLEFTK